MKLHKRMLFILGSISCILMGIIVIMNYQLCIQLEVFLKDCFPGVFIGQRGFFLNIFMGIFGSVLVSLVIEIVNYIVVRKNSIIVFLQKAMELNTLYKNVTYAFTSIDSVEYERELYKDILDYNMNDLYNAYFDIDFIIRKNKYSVLLQDVYISLFEVKNKVESKRQKILFSDDERFKEREAETIQKFFYEIKKVNGENAYQQEFYSDTISDRLEIIQNYLFKCVWYRVELPYDLIEKLLKLKPKFIFSKIGMFILAIQVIKWSHVVNKEWFNAYNQKDYIDYIKIPFTKYKIHYNKPIKIRTKDIIIESEKNDSKKSNF